MSYTSRSDFPKVLPDSNTAFCRQCHATSPEKTGMERVMFVCTVCGHQDSRILVYDPVLAHYFDEQDRLVHKSCGVFITRDDGKLLLFERRKYPFLLTIPAGHLEVGEDPMACAARETKEETGLETVELQPVYEGLIIGDTCMGGADIHYWNAYNGNIANDDSIILSDEGSSWGWYDPGALDPSTIVQPVAFMLELPAVRQKLGLK